MGTPKPLNTTTLMCIKHILRRNILCFNNLQKLSLTFILLFNYILSSFLHLSSMMPEMWSSSHSDSSLVFRSDTHLSLSQPASSLVFLCGSHYFVDFLAGLHTSMDCTLLQISNNVIPIESIFKLNYIANFN